MLISLRRRYSKAYAIVLSLIILGSLLVAFLFLQNGFAKSDLTTENTKTFSVRLNPSSNVELMLNQSQFFTASATSQVSSLSYSWSVESTTINDLPVNGTNYSLLTQEGEARFRFLDTSLGSCWLTVTAQSNPYSDKAVVRIENKNLTPPSDESRSRTEVNQQTPLINPQATAQTQTPPAQTAANPSATYSFFSSTASYIVETDGAGTYRAINGSTGAVAFTSNDAGAVITSAWNVAPTYLRNGKYECLTPIVAASAGLQLIGESRSGVVLTYKGQEAAILIVGPNTAEMKNFVTIESLTLDGNKTGFNGIYLENASVSKFSNIEIRAFLNDGLHYGTNTWSGILSDSFLHENGNAGVVLSDYSNEIRIDKCIINEDKYGILVVGDVDQLIVQNSQFTRSTLACIYAIGGIKVVDINANYFERSNASLIYFNPSKEYIINNGVISSNFFSIVKEYAINVNNTNNLMITGNKYQYCDLGEIIFGNAATRNIVNEPLQTIRVTGLGTTNALISVHYSPDGSYALRFNNMNMNQNAIKNGTSVTFTHSLAKKPSHVEIGWQNLGYGDWAWSANDQNITVVVLNKGTFNFSWAAWY